MHHHTRQAAGRLYRRLFLVLAMTCAVVMVHASVQLENKSAADGTAKVADFPGEAQPSHEELKAKLGQFFIFGLHGSELTERVRKHLQTTGVTAYILFRRNLQNNKQVTDLTTALHRFSQQQHGQPALIGLDQEGGKVVRIPFEPAIPSAYAMGRTRDPQVVEDLSFQVGRALRQLGFNVNFAPVLDLGGDTEYTFLGQRAFSSDPVWASDFGMSYARGQIRAKVLPVAKHFPGIGPVPNDPHLSLVRRSVSLEELRTRDLLPFENFARLPTSGIMISHLIYPKIDPTDTPGTFSKAIIEDLLQKQMGYTGLVVTDDLMMAGAQANKDFQESIVKAFQAGADLLMISWSEQRQKQAVAALTKAFDTGRISRDVVIARLAKMQRIRAQVKMDRLPRALDPHKLLVYNFKPYEKIVDSIVQKSLAESVRDVGEIQADQLLVLREQASLLENLSGTQDIRQGTVAQISQKLQRNHPHAMWVLFVRNKREADVAASISAKIRNQILLVNLWRPDLKVGTYPQRISFFMSHPKAQQWLAAWISARIPQSRAQPSSARSRFGRVPNLGLPNFRSVGDFQTALTDPDPLSRSLPWRSRPSRPAR